MSAGKKNVLLIGIDPKLVDFTPFPGFTAEKVLAALDVEQKLLIELGYSPQVCHTDLGKTAEAVVTERLSRGQFDCVLIGNGVRSSPANFLLFERLVNAVHAHAPAAKVCFNTGPGDTVAAIQRWL